MNKNTDTERIQNEFEETLYSGSVVKLAIHENRFPLRVSFRSLGPNYVSFHPRWQERLCRVLCKLCQDGGPLINTDLIKRTENGVLYLTFKVMQNHKLALRLFNGQDVGFAILQGKRVLKNYAIKLKGSRRRRSYPSKHSYSLGRKRVRVKVSL